MNYSLYIISYVLRIFTTVYKTVLLDMFGKPVCAVVHKPKGQTPLTLCGKRADTELYLQAHFLAVHLDQALPMWASICKAVPLKNLCCRWHNCHLPDPLAVATLHLIPVTWVTVPSLRQRFLPLSIPHLALCSLVFLDRNYSLHFLSFPNQCVQQKYSMIHTCDVKSPTVWILCCQ